MVGRNQSGRLTMNATRHDKTSRCLESHAFFGKRTSGELPGNLREFGDECTVGRRKTDADAGTGFAPRADRRPSGFHVTSKDRQSPPSKNSGNQGHVRNVGCKPEAEAVGKSGFLDIFMRRKLPAILSGRQRVHRAGPLLEHVRRRCNHRQRRKSLDAHHQVAAARP